MKFKLYFTPSFLLAGFIFLSGQAFSQRISGGTGHGIALCADGTLNAWGLNDQNELGLGVLTSNSCTCELSPVQVGGISQVKSVSAGGSHSLILLADSTIKAFGRNFDGELGDGIPTTTGCYCSLNTATVVGLDSIIGVSAGYIHSLALKADGTVWGWGSNSFGQLGLGYTSLTGCYCELAPLQVTGLSNIVAITSGNFHSLALAADSTVWAWGNNMYGQIGNGATSSNGLDTPVQLSLTGIVAIAAGQNHSYALKSDGTVWVWGWNYFGQLGNGTTIDNPNPQLVSGIDSVISISNGFNHTICLKSDSTVWSWGGNYSGQLGNGNTVNAYTPQMALGLTNVVELGGTMGNFSMVMKEDGSVWAWGDNFWGSVGNGSPTNQLSPVQVSPLCSIITEAIEPAETESFTVYPNPARVGEAFTLELEKGSSYIVFDLLGHTILQGMVNDGKLNFKVEQAGMYLLRVRKDQSLTSQKLIVE
jgi:alpha-tubulin suppressor-like RCC1 family protein